MRSALKILIPLFLAAGIAGAETVHTQAQLLLAADTAQPGQTVLAGIKLKMDPGWHTYWKNSGASGIPTKINWQLPAGITAGETEWPAPDKLPPDDLTTYIYSNEVVLLMPLKLASDLKPGAYSLKAKISWLECKELCLPGSDEVSANLKIGSATVPSADADLLRDWQNKLPPPGTNLNAHAWWAGAAKDDERPLDIEWAPAAPIGQADFYPHGSQDFEVQGATKRLPSEAGKVLLRKIVKKYEGNWPEQLSGLIIQASDNGGQAYRVQMPIAANAEAAGIASAAADTSTSSAIAAPGLATATLAQSLWKMLLYAFIGGLILNVMPCVLPVIALKILGFVGEARNDPRHVRFLGLIYTVGVLVSFLALAGLVIGVKAAGHKAGWGMQFSSPQFLVALTVLITLVALNLFGLFEINPGGRVLGAAGSLASRRGASGAFFNGVLATVLATPCTAPFLGVSLGFAFTQSAPFIALIFLAVGLGLAFPYLVLSWQPAWLKWLPKPGPWMQRFKIAMGFPLLATAIWLFSLLPSYYGPRAWWLGMFLVVIALAAWIYGEFIQRGRARRGLALGVMLALVIGGYAYLIEGQLDWRGPLEASKNGNSLAENPNGIQWQRWSQEAVAQARANGHPVLVDFTADWCLTCQANKRIAIETDAVRKKVKELGVVALLGDYTRFPDNITSELNRYGRAGVPLVLVYPAKPKSAPMILPELLTQGIVLDALNRATD